MSKRMPKTFVETVTAQPPEINVIPKDVMDKRVSEVFEQISSTLQKSLGPLGAHAIISQPPSYHVTKDGFTIMKNIRYNSEFGYVDQVISGMIADICGRLNYAVGDGTTSAVVSANAVYQNFERESDTIKKLFLLPRNIVARLKVVTERVIEELEKSAIQINNLDEETMCEYIRKVVYVSSNADKEMTDVIVDLYKKIGYPAINVVKAADGVTKGKVIEGFMFHSKLMDKLYINNDNNSQVGQHFDVIVFDHKVRLDAYKNFIKPLAFCSKVRGRKLVCIAPMYDDVALQGDIANDLNAEFRQTKDISLILMGYRMGTDHEKKRVNDLCMLLNTPIITQGMETELLRKYDAMFMSGNQQVSVFDILNYINLDYRNIPGLVVSKADGSYSEGESSDIEKDEKEFIFRVGHCDEAELYTDRDSIFRGFYYNEALYEKYLYDAKHHMETAIEKYKNLATFNFEVDNTKKRYQSLKLKMGQIEVGSKTQFSQDFLKDAMDDAVKAAESAYTNGIINGCHVSLMSAIRKVHLDPENSDIDKYLLRTLFYAFRKVRFSVLENGFKDTSCALYSLPRTDDVEGFLKGFNYLISTKLGVEAFFDKFVIDKVAGFTEFVIGKYSYKGGDISIFTLINEFELYTGSVLDLDMEASADKPKFKFSDTVINSTATDREILIATSDLVGLLTTGNQLVVTAGNHY